MPQNNALQSPPSFRVALLGIFHESNTFIAQPTTLENFTNSHWLKGDDIRREYEHSFHEIGGMLEVMDSHNIQTIPVMFAEATPGGIVSKETFELLIKEMMDELREQLPVDACLVVPHGAGVAEGYDDMDGHWLGILRQTVGKDIPIVGTLDPHANVSRAMTDATDALIAYTTNPHIDQRQTDKLAATLLTEFLYKKIKPVQYLVQTPVAISIEQQNTSAEPCKWLGEQLMAIRKRPGILSASLLLGFPYADVKDMGSSFIIVADDFKEEELLDLSTQLKSAILSVKDNCVGTIKDIKSILPELGELKKPVLMLDMGDNVGGGASGDSAFLLKAFEDYGTYRLLTCIYDPQAVREAARHNKNDTFVLGFGNEEGTANGKPYLSRVTLINKRDGKFTEKNPRHGGQVNYNMGDIVILETEAGNTVMLQSLRVPPFSLSQVTSFGIRPEQYDIIIAKGVNAPIAAYEVVCASIIQVNSPGETRADMTLLPYSKRRKPLFPFEQI